jgi:hypothetical protein
VVQSLDRHVPSLAEAVRGGPSRPFSRVGRGWPRKRGEMRAQPSRKKAGWMSGRCT